MSNYEYVAKHHEKQLEKGKRRIQCYISNEAFNLIQDFQQRNYLANIGAALDKLIRHPDTKNEICSECNGYGCNNCNEGWI
jgi:hypothetical protein